MSLLDHAITIAVAAHEDQVDKAGEPYILHPLRVMFAIAPEDRVVAVLHDVLEDSPSLTLYDRLGELLSDEQMVTLGALTREPDEPYFDYIERVRKDPAARRIKIADLRDNLSREAPHTEKLKEKYVKALRMLL